MIYLFVMVLFVPCSVFAEGETSEPTASADTSTTVVENEEQNMGPEVSATTAILIDSATGAVIARKDASKHMDPTGLTKIMSIYLAVENLSNTQQITMSSTAYETYDHSTSVIWVMDGETISALDLEYASLIQNANDTTAMLAEAVSGSEEAFINRMNAMAQELGMNDTNFQNIFGLNNENNYSSAKDLAILVRRAMRNETFREIFGASSWTIDPTNLQSNTRVIAQGCEFLRSGDHYYDETDGCKVGYTQEGGYALATVATRGDTTLIAVVLGESTEDLCYEDTRTLLEYGFTSYHTVEITSSDIGTKVVEVYDGNRHTQDVTFSVSESFSALLPTSVSKEDLTTEIVVTNETSNDPDQMSAQVRFLLNGEQVGSADMQKRVTEAVANSNTSSTGGRDLPTGPRAMFDYFCIGVLAILILRKVSIALAPPK